MSTPTLPNVASKFGAPMGRRGDVPKPAKGVRCYLGRVKLDRGGYDPGGAYWGIGAPLYHVQAEDGSISQFYRAWDRETAKEKVLKDFPGATFFR